MRPYLAILKDSFREIFATRVLWFMLIGISLFLLALLPISLTEKSAQILRITEIVNVKSLLAEIKEASDQEEASPGKYIWGLLTNEEQSKVNEYIVRQEDEPPHRTRMREQRALGAINKIISKKNIYDEESYKQVKLKDSVRELAEQGQSGVALGKLNRKLISAAFPQQIALTSDDALFLGYFWMELDFPLPLSKSQVKPIIEQIIAGALSLILGTFGIFVSILVTAGIIPRAFEPGEISLLLSKPISRSMLFLSKFAGGCAFTFVNVLYLMTGLWLIAGFKFDLWNYKILYCVPVYLFVFSIYYSVSAWAGVRWKNAILCISITVMFWFFLFALNATKSSLDLFYIKPMSLREIAVVDDGMFAVTNSRVKQEWNDATNSWVQVMKHNRNGRPFAVSQSKLAVDPDGQGVLVVEPASARYGGYGPTNIVNGLNDSGWEENSIVTLNETVFDIFFDPEKRGLIVCSNGIYELSKPFNTKEKRVVKPKNNGGIFGNMLAASGTPSYVAIHPEEYGLLRPTASASGSSVNGSVAVYQAGELKIFNADESKNYELASTITIDEDKRAGIVANSTRLAVCSDKGKVWIIDEEKISQTIDIGSTETPREIHISHNQRYIAVLFHTGNLWLYDLKQKQEVSHKIAGQGTVSALSFTNENKLILGYDIDRIQKFDLATMVVEQKNSPDLETTMMIYRWGVAPLYTVFPKPAELDQLVSYFVTEKKEEVLVDRPFQQANLNQERVTYDPWASIPSNVAFLAVMLGLSCWYISTRDF